MPRPRGRPRESYLVFASPQLLDAEIDEVVATLRITWIGAGPKVARFERTSPRSRQAGCGATRILTATLHLALVTLGLQPTMR